MVERSQGIDLSNSDAAKNTNRVTTLNIRVTMEENAFQTSRMYTAQSNTFVIAPTPWMPRDNILSESTASFKQLCLVTVRVERSASTTVPAALLPHRPMLISANVIVDMKALIANLTRTMCQIVICPA